MNSGPPDPSARLQARSGDRPWPGEPAWHGNGRRRPPTEPTANAPRPRNAAGSPYRPPAADSAPLEPTLVLEVDLRDPLPDIAGGTVSRVWLLLRVGGVAVGGLFLGVPGNGLRSADIGAAVAARIGARRRGAPAHADAQPRSRRRGSTSSL
jgi:hypothetical protein